MRDLSEEEQMKRILSDVNDAVLLDSITSGVLL